MWVNRVLLNKDTKGLSTNPRHEDITDICPDFDGQVNEYVLTRNGLVVITAVVHTSNGKIFFTKAPLHSQNFGLDGWVESPDKPIFP